MASASQSCSVGSALDTVRDALHWLGSLSALAEPMR